MRRVVVLDHTVQPFRGSRSRVRCQKFPNKPNGVFVPTKNTPANKKVKTITKDGLLKAVKREARKGSNKESGVN